MNSKQASKLFIQFHPMIQQAIWRQLKFYRLEKEDLEAQAYYIFCECINTYDKSKASFSTYLYKGLKDKLSNYCRLQAKRFHKFLEDDFVEYSFNTFLKTMEVIDSKISLSEDAKVILDYIISRRWEVPGQKYNKKPSYSSIYRWYHFMHSWDKVRLEKAWNELTTWWREVA